MSFPFSPGGLTGIDGRRRAIAAFASAASAGAASASAARRGPATPRSAPVVQREASVNRKKFTDRLGLPATATDSEILATVDTKKAQADTAKAANAAERELDALYASAWGDGTTLNSTHSAEDQALLRAAGWDD